MRPAAWIGRTASIVAMLAEYPQRSTEALICLAPAGEAPPGPHEAARDSGAEVLTTEQTWVPATVLAWYRLPEPLTQILTYRRISWLVQLHLADGTEDWYQFASMNLRPLKQSGSSSASGK
jgi:hypothetical protein